jgi:4-amino-4-deoxy-L-arabinose transferase-like glycosyltransferase
VAAVRADRVALALIAVFGVIYALIARYAFDAFPYSGDEYSLALQGELFARGLLHAPAPAHLDWLRVDQVVLVGDLVRSKYPPGAPMLLAVGARFGCAWLVTPIEGVLALVVAWVTTRRLLDGRAALVAVVAIGLAPLFAFEAATFYAHTPALLFLAVAYAGVAWWTMTKRTGWLVLTGVALGIAFLIRPLDALLFGFAMLSLRSVRAIVVTAIAAAPIAALTFVYQATQFGAPFTDGYKLYEPTHRAIYGLESSRSQLSPLYLFDPVQQWFHIDIVRAFAMEWTVPGVVVLAVFGAYAITRDHVARPMRSFSLALIATYVGVLLFTIADPDDGARPRYLSTVLVPVAFLAAAGFAPAMAGLVARFGRRARGIAVVIAIVFALGQLAAILVARLPAQWQREGLYQVVAAAELHDAVVIVRAQYPSRYARNGPFFDGNALYLSAPPDVDAAAIHAAYPGRAIWEAHEAHDGTPWTLARRY